jgi:hypothetical protein
MTVAVTDVGAPAQSPRASVWQRLRHGRGLPLLFVVGVIMVIWYGAAIRLNAPQLIDGYERREENWTIGQLVGDAWSMERPVLPAPAQRRADDMTSPPGVFASWQPRYAEFGIPTFPVRIGSDKKPRTNGFLNVGIGGSRQLAIKFPTDDAFGFVPGKRTRITVLDIDSISERERDDAFSRHGEPAIVVRTPSGGWHGWYRHAGERRRIRPWGPARPIDVLGGGYVVAPPSQGPHGCYEFVKGELEDVPRLAPLRGVDLAPAAAVTMGGTLVQEGERHKTLLRYCQEQARHCDDLEQLIDVARIYAENNLDMTGMTHAYSDAQVIDAASWAWALEVKGLNLVGRGGATVVRHGVVDSIAASDPDAYALWSILWRHNSDRREFILANAMADGLGWDLRRFKRARSRLCRPHGLIECTHLGGRGVGDPPRYRWPRGAAAA